MKKSKEKALSICIFPSVARDLIIVLEKFSRHKAELLQVGQKNHASRLLALNLFREEVREKLLGNKKK